MELLLTVESPGGEARDLAVELEPDCPAHALVEAVAHRLDLPAADVAGLQVARTGTFLTGGRAVAEADLRDGDRLLVKHVDRDAPTDTGRPAGEGAVVDLVVVSGPLMGTRIGLGPGKHAVGRGPGADVLLDDPSLSRRHFGVEVGDSAVVVSDLGSRNGTHVAGVPLTEARPLGQSDALEAGRSVLRFEPSSHNGRSVRGDGRGGVSFNRPPRVARPPRRERFPVPAPPAEQDNPRLPLGAALIPLVLSGAMFAVIGSPYILMFGLLTPAMALYSYTEARGRGKRTRVKGERDFAAALDAVVAELESGRAEEAAARRAAAPGADELLARAASLTPSLWERRPRDDDFLALRVGISDRPSDLVAEVASGGSRELAERAERRLEATATLTSVPVGVAARAGLGLAGPAERTLPLARWLVAQAAVHHSPADLVIAAALTRAGAREWEWLKWLPHARGGGRLAVGEGMAGELLGALAGHAGRHVLLLVDGELEIDRSQLADLVSDHVSLVWLAREARDVPGECGGIVELDPGVARLTVTDARTGEIVAGVTADGVGDAWAEELARHLAPVRDTSDRDEAARVPARVSLLDLLELDDVTPAAVQDRWEASEDHLRAPLGRTADGIFNVDAGRTDGLRVLIGGMPGAGKSELLQSLVGALAATHPPDRLAFLLVDYKGGAAFKDCIELPHTVGLVTDLDAHLAERARVSLLAELRRREALLAEAGARGLAELARRPGANAPPALIIVVDEFATLVREVPAFVDTMVDVAQRGRSLGLHLVLATQRPRGAVNDTIRANTNLRIAMRMADAAESSDVIETGAAAEIAAGTPGRALALTGRRSGGSPELTEFQSAYAGGRSAGMTEAAVTLADFEMGQPRLRAERVVSMVGRPGDTDLQAIVAACALAAERLGIERPASPWLPPLPPVVDLASLQRAATPDAPVVGLLDEPARQVRRPLAFDLEADGSLLVFGTSGSGKTTLLRTLAASLAQSAGPRELQVYGLDFATRGLRALDALPHCGTIVAGDDEERVWRLLNWLQRVMAQRREFLAGRGAASLGEHRRRAPDGPPIPRIVVLLDGYGAFASAFERVRFGEAVQAVTRIAAEGRPLGVHLIVAADRRASVPGALLGVVPGRLILRMADDDDYPALGLQKAAVAGAELPPGRGFTAEGLEFQTAVAGARPDDQAAALAELGARLRERHPGESAAPIGVLPARVARALLPAPSEALLAPIGLAYETLQPAAADLRDDHFLVAGPLRSGRTTALLTLATSLLRADPAAELHLLAPRRSDLTGLPGWASSASGADACRQAIDRLVAALDRPSGSPPVVIVIDDAMELGELPALETLVRRGRDAGVRVAAAVETPAALRAYGGWSREIRNGRNGLLLRADPETDGDLLGARLPRQGPALPPGRGWHVAAGGMDLVQVAG